MRKWLPLVAICAGTFMLLVDVTIVNVALPDMARSLHTTFSDLQWVIDIYALVLAALVLTAGSVADRIGRRTVYLAGLVLFAASSAASGAATSAAMLIAARGVQGLGAAMMFATTIALLSNSYQGRDRGVAFGAWGATNGAAAAAGPILGGLLTTHVGWRWIFYVNLPVSVIAVAMTALVITESRDPAARRIDLPGMVTFTAAAACLTYALIRGGWSSPATLGLLGSAIVMLASFVVIELKRRDPMLDLSLLRNRAFSALIIAGALMSVAAWAAMTYESLWLQSLLGKSAIGAGLVLLPAALMAFVVSAGLGRHMHRFSPRLLIGTGMAIIAAGALAQAMIRSGSAGWVIMPGTALVGAGAGLVMGPMSSAAMAMVPHQKAGMAAGAFTTFRQLGYAFGIAVLGEVFSGGLTRVAGARTGAELTGGEAGNVLARDPGLSRLVHEAFAAGLDQTLLVAAGLGVIGAVIVVAFVRTPTQPAVPAAAPSPATPVRQGQR
ncbi:MAG: MFS transporter [Streptosporangiaceae bacterium]|jgi:EmrB/QacA subfamily drug resistance transporter